MSALAHLPDALIAQFMNGPAWYPPSGTTAASTESDTLWATGTASLAVGVIISTLGLAVRLITQVKLLRRWHLEDTLLVIAWILLVFYSVENSLSVYHGAGKHMWNIILHNFYDALYYINVGSIVYCIIIGLIKIAILLQYLRIFVPHRVHGQRAVLFYIIWTTIAMIAVFYIILVFLTTWICTPREAYWNPYVKGTCRSWQALSQAVCIFNVVSDFALLLIPIYPVSRLHMAKKRKIMIGLLFAVGFIDCIASIVRSYYTWVLIESPDISWNIVIMGSWTFVEIAFAMLVASLPVTPRFIKYLKQRSSNVSNSWRSSRLRFYHSNGQTTTARTHTNAVHVRTEVKVSSSPRLSEPPKLHHKEYEEIATPDSSVTYPKEIYAG